MRHEPALQTLRSALDQLQQQALAVDTFCTTWRNQVALLNALPPRYRQVLEDLLGRLEAGSLFTEESCSFSQQELHANLAHWLEKARQTLITQASHAND